MKIQHSMLANTMNKNISTHNNGSIMVIYRPFIDSCLYESNILNSMLALCKDNNDLVYNELK